MVSTIMRVPSTLSTVQVLAALVIAGSAVLAVRTFTHPPKGRPAGGDFIGFYVPARTILDAPQRLYDLNLQAERRRQFAGVDVELPFAHAPFLAVILAPLGLVRFHTAYFIWMAVSATMYAAAVVLVAPRNLRQWALSLAFLCPLFPLYGMAAGQVIALDCLAIALAIYFERKNRPYLSGAILALCGHKPTILACQLLMLLVTRHFRSCLGLLAGVVALSGVSVAVVGKSACAAWISLVLRWGATAVGSSSRFNKIKYTDINSFVRLMHTTVAIAVLVGCLLMVIASVSVLVTWLSGRRELAWAAAVAAPLVLNVYAGVYESPLLVLAVALMSHYKEALADWAPQIIGLLLAATLTQGLAAKFGFQVLTVAIVGVLVWQAALAARSGPRVFEST